MSIINSNSSNESYATQSFQRSLRLMLNTTNALPANLLGHPDHRCYPQRKSMKLRIIVFIDSKSSWILVNQQFPEHDSITIKVTRSICNSPQLIQKWTIICRKLINTMETQNQFKMNQYQDDASSYIDWQSANITCGEHYRGVVNLLRKYWYFTCQICCNTCEKSEMTNFTKCTHIQFCKSCMSRYAKFKIIDYQEIKCPIEDCRAVMDINSDFFFNLPVEMQKKYKKIHTSVQKLHDANLRMCPESDCEGNIIFKNTHFACILCKEKFCLNCLSKQHKGQCYQNDIDYLQKILRLKRCPSCKFLVERSSGCNYLKCRCNFEFCYACNDVYTPLHRCRYDANSQIIMVKPTFQDEGEIKAEGEEVKEIKESSLADKVLFVLMMFGFLVPSLLVLGVVYLVLMILLTAVFIVKTGFIVFLVTLLGIGPFTLEFSKLHGGFWRIILLAAYPVTSMIGIYRAFRQLSSCTIGLVYSGFKSDGTKCRKYLFVQIFE